MLSDKRVDSAKRAQTARLGQSGATGKRKRCKKGRSCGASCINNSKFCLVDLPWVGQGLAKLRAEIQKMPKSAGKISSKPPTFQPASKDLPPGANKVSSVLGLLSSPGVKTSDVDGILSANRVNWESGRGKGANYVASGAYGAFVHVPEERLAKGLEGKFPGGAGVKYGDVSPEEVELLKKIGESGAGPRLIAARYESEPSYPGATTRKGMIAMERIPGETLEEASYKISEEELGDGYLKAMSKLHRVGISHGDAHLGNAILQPNGEVKFVDFGYAEQNPMAALEEIQSRIWDFGGPVSKTIRDNMDRMTKEIDKFDWNKGNMTPEYRDKKAMEILKELYREV